MKKPLRRKIAAYSVGAGAAALATSAHADVHYSGPLNFSGDVIYFDLLNSAPPSNDSQAEDNFRLDSSNNGQKPAAYGLTGSTATGSVAFTKVGSLKYTPEFHTTDTIGSQLSFSSEGALNNFASDTPSGQWHVGDRGFLGLEIVVNGQTDYGWAEISLNNGGTPPSRHSNHSNPDDPTGQFTLYGYAYDDSGLPIGAGAIPEPSSLALLVAGAAGVAALRRRKKVS